VWVGLVGCMILTAPPYTDAATAMLSNSLNPHIGALGALSAPGSATLTHTGTLFNAFTGTVALQYRARTSAAGGGTLTLKVTQDFQTGGPSVAGGDLAYICGAASLGTACGSTTASTSSATQVVTLPSSACTGGGSPCSATDPNSVSLTFTLADQPAVKTGSYTATVLFTISAT
jgi:hypothetical protein